MNLVATVREHGPRSSVYEGKTTVRHILVLLDNAPPGDCLNQFPEYELTEDQQKAHPDGSLVGKTVNVSVAKITGLFQGAPRIAGRLVVVNK